MRFWHPERGVRVPEGKREGRFGMGLRAAGTPASNSVLVILYNHWHIENVTEGNGSATIVCDLHQYELEAAATVAVELEANQQEPYQ